MITSFWGLDMSSYCKAMSMYGTKTGIGDKGNLDLTSSRGNMLHSSCIMRVDYILWIYLLPIIGWKIQNLNSSLPENLVFWRNRGIWMGMHVYVKQIVDFFLASRDAFFFSFGPVDKQELTCWNGFYHTYTISEWPVKIN